MLPLSLAHMFIHEYRTLFPLNKYLLHYCLSLWKFFSAKLKGLVTDHRSSGWDLGISALRPSLHVWLGTQGPFQDAAGEGHWRSIVSAFSWCVGMAWGLPRASPCSSSTLLYKSIEILACSRCSYVGVQGFILLGYNHAWRCKTRDEV